MWKSGSAPVATILLPAILLIGCSGPKSSVPGNAQKRGGKVVNLYTWADYIAPEVLESFKRTTGVTVSVAIIETSGTLETRMLTGNSGYDLVVPMAPYFQRQIRSGAYLPLDKAKLPNLRHLDSNIMARVASNDPGNAHGIVYAWGTFGLGYDEKKVSEMLPGVPLDSWRLIFDPAFASKLAACGINILDSPAMWCASCSNTFEEIPTSPARRILPTLKDYC